MDILKIKYIEYIGVFINFTTTLMCFPVLVFQIYLPVNEKWLFLILTFLFNIGDLFARYIGPLIIFKNLKILNILCIFKVFMILILYILSNSQNVCILFPILILFTFGFLNGFLCIKYFDHSTNDFVNNENKKNSGFIFSSFLQSGLLFGAFLSNIW